MGFHQNNLPAAASLPSREQGGADYDEPYTWGRPPATYLSFRQIVRLTILRSKLHAARVERVTSLESPGSVAPALL